MNMLGIDSEAFVLGALGLILVHSAVVAMFSSFCGSHKSNIRFYGWIFMVAQREIWWLVILN